MSELGGFPTPPAPPLATPARSTRNWPLILGATLVASLLLITGGVLIVKAREPHNQLRALDRPIEHPERVLRRAELYLESLEEGPRIEASELAIADDAACWFSYPSGKAEPNKFLRCGPILYADSAPDAYWINLPVEFRRSGDATMVSPNSGKIAPHRTYTLNSDEKLIRPDRNPPDVDAIRLHRPGAKAAREGSLAVVDPEDIAAPLDHTPDDGRLRGYNLGVDVQAWGYTDRVRLPRLDTQPTAVYEPPKGQRWLLVGVNAVVAAPSDQFSSEPTTRFSLAVGDKRVQLPEDELVDVAADRERPRRRPLRMTTDDPGSFDAVIVVGVPTGTDDLALVATDDGLTQEWAFSTGKRSGKSPTVLYRDPDELLYEIGETFTLPYEARSAFDMPAQDFGDLGTIPAIDDSSDFGEVELKVELDAASLSYSVPVPTPQGVKAQRASAPDKALLTLGRIETGWGDFMHELYRLKPGDAVVTLADGTKIPAQLPAGQAVSEFAPENFTGGTLVWEVPADLTKATLTITPSRQANVADTFTIDFRGGKIEIPLEFRKRD